jgi:hypothetical protein
MEIGIGAINYAGFIFILIAHTINKLTTS